jgi:hypothetical protein
VPSIAVAHKIFLQYRFPAVVLSVNSHLFCQAVVNFSYVRAQ